MHPTAMQNADRFFKTYGPPIPDGATVIDIGSQDVNGSLREVCPSRFIYMGLDFEVGKGVDLVLSDPYDLTLRNESVDIVVSSSCFEHSEMFWLTFAEIMRVLKPRGLFYLNVPSNGPFHRYPNDCWRFYPDAGIALITWAQRCGFNPRLLESFTTEQAPGMWNDFVAVFVKDEFYTKHTYPHRILTTHPVAYTNGRIDVTGHILHRPCEIPEDMRRRVR